MSSVKPIPEGFHTLSPSLVTRDAARAMAFYREAFGAEQVLLMKGPQGSVMHAEMRIGDTIFMLSDEWPGHHVQAPATVNSTTVTMHLYVEDVDAWHKRAVAAGAKEIMPPEDMFWGDRFSSVMDPFGHSWSLATHVKDLTEEECQQAADAWMAQMSAGGQEGS